MLRITIFTPSRFLLALLMPILAAAEEPMPVHDELPSSVIAYAVIPSLPTLLQHTQLFAGSFRAIAKGRLLGVSSQILGDPDFAHLDTHRPLVVALLSSPSSSAPVVAAWIPTVDGDPGTYEKAARTWGMSAHAQGSLTVVAGNDDDLARSSNLIGFYKSIAAQGVSADLRLHCACDRAWLAYGDALREQAWLAASRLAYLPRPAGAPDFVPVMRMALAGAIAVIQDLQDLQIDLTVDDKSVQSRIDGVAQPGSALAAVLVAPAVLPDAGAILGPGGGITTLVGRLDPHAVSKFATIFLQRIALQEQLTLNETVLAALADYGSGTNGSFALRIAPDAVHGVGLCYIHGVESAASGLAFAQRMAAHFNPITPSESPSALQLPLSISLQSEAPSADTKIDHLKVVLSSSTLSADALTALRAYCRDGDIAFTPAWTLCVQDQSQLESLIARATADHLAQQEVTLAQSTLPAGYNFYADSDLVGMVLASVAILNPTASGNPQTLHQALAKHQQREPLIIGARYANGAMRWQVRMPVAPLVALKDAAREAMSAASNAAAPSAPLH
jgi:hypothetical protein